MKRIIQQNIAVLLLVQLLASTGCQKNGEDERTATAMPERELLAFTGPNSSQNRIAVVQLSKDTVYVLNQDFDRLDGEQLLIEAGTLIKVNTSGQPIGIFINPGAVITANGSRTAPIVFTSSEIPGSQGRNWSGVNIRGRSRNNAAPDRGDVNDFSGSLTYARIEFAGLKLREVGSGTIIGNIQVSYATPQPAYEIDGGTFNAKHLLSYACGGPADFYFTSGYRGKMQHLLAYRHPFFARINEAAPFNTLTGLFIENSPADPQGARPFTYPILSNVTVIGPDRQNGAASAYTDTTVRTAALVTTGSAGFNIRNSVFLGFPAAGWYLDDFNTAYGLHYELSLFKNSIMHSNNRTHFFYLLPGAYPPFGTNDFEDFEMEARFNNRMITDAEAFMFTDPYNYDKPGLLPLSGSPVLTGADFTDPVYSDPFFEQVGYVGALGTGDWTEEWTNFTPLKTNYNFPK